MFNNKSWDLGLQVFYQLIYEYQKELRDLCLFTCHKNIENKIKKTFERQKINYKICHIDNDKINVFFGMPTCIDVLNSFSCEELNNLTVEEDFILGIMLGYGKNQQYKRLLARKKMCA